MDILRAGPYDRGFTKVLEQAGLAGFTAPGTAAAVMGQALDALAALDAKVFAEAPAA